MGNKLWIAALGFCAFVFAALGIGGFFLARMFRDPLRTAILPMLWMSFLSWYTARLAVSRIRYGPKGPPPDPLQDFHIDF